jgi:hypothetical protein
MRDHDDHSTYIVTDDMDPDRARFRVQCHCEQDAKQVATEFLGRQDGKVSSVHIVKTITRVRLKSKLLIDNLADEDSHLDAALSHRLDEDATAPLPAYADCE